MDQLPAEVLRQIATYLPYDSVHSLSLVSRRVRLACHDWQVYKAIIDGRNHRTLGNLYGSDGLLKWTRNPIASSTVSPDECALYARADYKCWTISLKEYQYMYPSFVQDFVQWGGVMAARAHPFTQLQFHNYTHLHHLGMFTRSNDLSAADKYIFTFWAAVHLLSFPIPVRADWVEGISPAQGYRREPPFSRSIEDGRLSIYDGWNQLIKKLRPDRRWYRDTLEDLVRHDIPERARGISALPFQELCVKSVGLLGYKYRLSRLWYGYSIPPTTRARFDPRSVKPGPLGTEIPFESFMDLPLPFRGGSGVFAGCHLKTMTSMKFLEDGAWMGFKGSGSLQYFDLGIIDVRFKVIGKVIRNSDGHDEILDGSMPTIDPEYDHASYLLDGQTGVESLVLQGLGSDSNGEIHFYGSIFPASGRITLTTKDENGRMIYWLAFMTPFGIFGKQAADGGVLVNTDAVYLWLWKEDWYGS
ncbi:hypothetical protein TWF481_011322 [Arthrobotrys musiformis]|uniref:F-box domain-containing protein n=1 Tax=Arthrobotrys musiformis TaxID=47236 RepID=A0AAV9VZW6_9PEZI